MRTYPTARVAWEGEARGQLGPCRVVIIDSPTVKASALGQNHDDPDLRVSVAPPIVLVEEKHLDALHAVSWRPVLRRRTVEEVLSRCVAALSPDPELECAHGSR